jgi:hypothetical protein
MTSGIPREVLTAEPAPAAWRRILAALSGQVEGDATPGAPDAVAGEGDATAGTPDTVAGKVDAADQALRDWPDEIRAAPPGAWAEIERGQSPPSWWGLVRALTLGPGEGLQPTEALRSVRILDLGRDADGLDLDDLADLPNLSELRLWGGTLSDLTPFADLPGLTALDIEGATLLTDVTPLGELTGLTRLRLRGAAQLSDVGPLAGLHRLRTLLLSDCASLVDLAPLADLPSLAYVDLSGSPNARCPDRWRERGVTVQQSGPGR